MAIKTNYEKNGSKYYRVTRTVGHRANGSAIKKEFYGENKSEAEEKANEYINKIKLGLNSDFDKTTLGELFHYWVFDIVKMDSKRKHSTFERYESTYRIYIKDSNIASLIISDIKNLPIQNYYNSLYKNGKKTSIIQELDKELKAFFNWAVLQNYMPRNPCQKLAIPGNGDTILDEDTDIKFFTYEEIDKIQANYNDDNLKYACILGLGMGLREGEILGLQYKNIDLQNGFIYIRTTLSKKKKFDGDKQIGSELVLTSPKTKSSIRKLKIPKEILIKIKTIIDRQFFKWKSNNLIFNNDSLIFTTNTCKAIDASDFRTAWKRLLKRSNVEYKKFHTLRHTFASILFHRQVQIKTVQQLLGHSSIQTTEKIYVHVMPSTRESASEEINFLFKN